MYGGWCTYAVLIQIVVSCILILIPRLLLLLKSCIFHFRKISNRTDFLALPLSRSLGVAHTHAASVMYVWKLNNVLCDCYIPLCTYVNALQLHNNFHEVCCCCSFILSIFLSFKFRPNVFIFVRRFISLKMKINRVDDFFFLYRSVSVVAVIIIVYEDWLPHFSHNERNILLNICAFFSCYLLCRLSVLKSHIQFFIDHNLRVCYVRCVRGCERDAHLRV